MSIKILLSTRLGEKRWTQADLARKTGIRPSTINDMYHDISERINLDHLDKICEALECDISDILVRIPGSGAAMEVRDRRRAGTGEEQNT